MIETVQNILEVNKRGNRRFSRWKQTCVSSICFTANKYSNGSIQSIPKIVTWPFCSPFIGNFMSSLRMAQFVWQFFTCCCSHKEIETPLFCHSGKLIRSRENELTRKSILRPKNIFFINSMLSFLAVLVALQHVLPSFKDKPINLNNISRIYETRYQVRPLRLSSFTTNRPTD